MVAYFADNADAFYTCAARVDNRIVASLFSQLRSFFFSILVLVSINSVMSSVFTLSEIVTQ